MVEELARVFETELAAERYPLEEVDRQSLMK